ncbi:MAG: hypothetical protein AABZ74_12270 [Cyanobacteriota bacterium]
MVSINNQITPIEKPEKTGQKKVNIQSCKNSITEKTPIEKSCFKNANDSISIASTLTGVIQSPEQIALFPKTLNDAGEAIKTIPVLSKVTPNVVKTATYLEGTKIISVANNISHNPLVAKTSLGMGKALPYLNAGACTYGVTKNLYILSNKNTSDSHKMKAATQVVLNSVNGVAAFKGATGMAISTVTGLTSVAVDFLWK